MYVSSLLSQACHWQGNKDQNRGMIPLKVRQAPTLAVQSHAFFPHRMDSQNLGSVLLLPFTLQPSMCHSPDEPQFSHLQSRRSNI